jgi:hypothetical protein
MKLRTLFGWAAIVVSAAMPLTVVNMVAAYAENAVAMATLSSSANEVRRLSDLYGDVQSLPVDTASALLSRHGMVSVESLEQRLDVARANVLQAQTELKTTGQRVWRNSAVGSLCVAVTSWAALALATVWPRKRRSSIAVAV